MNESFITVFDLIETGYRGLNWSIVLGALLLTAVVYLILLRPQTTGDKVYRYGFAVVVLIAVVAFSIYQFRVFSTYLGFANALKSGNTEVVTGHIANLFYEDYFFYIDVEGQRLRSSKYEWPYSFGYHSDDFQLKPTFLIRAHLVDQVIVRLQVHKVHF